MYRISSFLFALAASASMAGVAAADPVLSIYGGLQAAPSSHVSVSDGTDFDARWQGKSLQAPPYWGVRGTWWLTEMGYDNFGVSLDYSHAKVYASQSTLNKTGWDHFEFTDGINIATANVLYRFTEAERAWTPYVGVGLGVNVPHVEVIRPSGRTWNYQLGGVAAQAQAGVDFALTEHISAFTEYKVNFSHVNVDIDSGDTLKTSIFTHALNIGLSYKF